MQHNTKLTIQFILMNIAWLFVMILYVTFPVGALVKLILFCHSMNHWIYYNMLVIYGIGLVVYLRYGLRVVKKEFALFASVVFPSLVLGGKDASL